MRVGCPSMTNDSAPVIQHVLLHDLRGIHVSVPARTSDLTRRMFPWRVRGVDRSGLERAGRVPGRGCEGSRPVNSAWASLDIGADGSLGRRPAYPVLRQPRPIPAADLRQFHHVEGVYTYDPQAQELQYESTQRSSRRLRRRRMRRAATTRSNGTARCRSTNSALRASRLSTDFHLALGPVPPAPWYRSGAAPPTRQ